MKLLRFVAPYSMFAINEYFRCEKDHFVRQKSTSEKPAFRAQIFAEFNFGPKLLN